MFHLHAHQCPYPRHHPPAHEVDQPTLWVVTLADTCRYDGTCHTISLADALGFRAKSDNLGAIFNILVYTPCFTTISMGIYNIEATHANRRKMNIVCACIYAAIIAVFCIGYSNSGSLNIGYWLYAMLVLFGANVAYCIYMIMIEMRKRKKC